ncbi:sentrin-specific protease 5-like [Brachionichthys hirsutus]|uniref:sentrin-specific protease 5-like n=1 Tax=Brachionichthys hirsutus TaxID=412623 RepID=UPI0036043BFF
MRSWKNEGRFVSPDAGCSDDTLGEEKSETFGGSGFSSGLIPEPPPPPPKTETSARLSGMTDPSKSSHAVKPVLSAERGAGGSSRLFKEPRTLVLTQSGEAGGPSERPTAGPRRREATSVIGGKRAASSQADLKILVKDIREYLDHFYGRYGSFIPLQKSDVSTRLKKRFGIDFSEWKNVVFSEVAKYQTVVVQAPAPSFQVVYGKHTLALDDLSTLADQNWLNDQVMNMYGELIVDSVDGKVHFLNSFFHRQLMTKGYDGVKRWTKKVDLFSKSLVFVPVHLEVHWCLVTADNVKKMICLYDSQGTALQKVARNILKYLTAEAKEKKQSAFESGWAVSYDEKIPQQTNENDCGVFVLEYSRLLALGKPLQFSQKDIPKIRKRIYRELCDCKLHEHR